MFENSSRLLDFLISSHAFLAISCAYDVVPDRFFILVSVNVLKGNKLLENEHLVLRAVNKTGSPPSATSSTKYLVS